MPLILDYRFTILLENSLLQDFVMKKLTHQKAPSSISIICGLPACRSNFNPFAFIDATNFPTLKAIIDQIYALDKDRDDRDQRIKVPVFRDRISHEMRLNCSAESFVKAREMLLTQFLALDVNRPARRLTDISRVGAEVRDANCNQKCSATKCFGAQAHMVLFAITPKVCHEPALRGQASRLQDNVINHANGDH